MVHPRMSPSRPSLFPYYSPHSQCSLFVHQPPWPKLVLTIDWPSPSTFRPRKPYHQLALTSFTTPYTHANFTIAPIAMRAPMHRRYQPSSPHYLQSSSDFTDSLSELHPCLQSLVRALVLPKHTSGSTCMHRRVTLALRQSRR